MKNRSGKIFLAALLLCLGAAFNASAQRGGDEAAIRQIPQDMQDSWNRKDGKGFAAHFAEEHDFVNIRGLYWPKATRTGNAAVHQELFDGVYKEVDLQLSASKVRFLSVDVAVAHLQGHTYTKGKPEEKRQEVVITATMQKKNGRWEIVAFQNTPVLPRSN